MVGKSEGYEMAGSGILGVGGGRGDNLGIKKRRGWRKNNEGE